MEQLYPNLWVSREGDICDENGVYTKKFLFWCKKLSGLRDDQYTHAFKQLEERCATNSATGMSNYPPSYAEFLGMSRVKKMHQQYQAPQIGYTRQDRNEKGQEECAKLKDLMSSATIITGEEADKIIAAGQLKSMQEHYATNGIRE